METKPERASRYARTDVWAYITLAFAFSWIAWILAIKLHAREEFLNFGSAGPAFAAMTLSRNRQPNPSCGGLRRGVIFCALLLVCWAVLCLHYSWRASSDLRFSLNPRLLGPAILPA
jgi:hypothetical protein